MGRKKAATELDELDEEQREQLHELSAWEEVSALDLHYPLRMFPGTGKPIPLPVALASLRERARTRAYGWDPHAGQAFHKALCAAMGVRPTTDGLYAGIAKALGLGRTTYHGNMHHGQPLRAIRGWCDELSLEMVHLHSGLVVVCSPGYLQLAGPSPEAPPGRELLAALANARAWVSTARRLLPPSLVEDAERLVRQLDDAYARALLPAAPPSLGLVSAPVE